MSRTTATTGASRSGRRSCGCARRRIAERPILSYSLRVEPAEHFVNWQQDPFANHLARLVFPGDDDRAFKVTVDLVADMAVYNPFDFFLEPEAETYPFAYDPELKHDLAPYLARGELTPRLQTFIDSDRPQ